jgi:hypothetical protein
MLDSPDLPSSTPSFAYESLIRLAGQMKKGKGLTVVAVLMKVCKVCMLLVDNCLILGPYVVCREILSICCLLIINLFRMKLRSSWRERWHGVLQGMFTSLHYHFALTAWCDSTVCFVKMHGNSLPLRWLRHCYPNDR